MYCCCPGHSVITLCLCFYPSASASILSQNPRPLPHRAISISLCHPSCGFCFSFSSHVPVLPGANLDSFKKRAKSAWPGSQSTLLRSGRYRPKTFLGKRSLETRSLYHLTSTLTDKLLGQKCFPLPASNVVVIFSLTNVLEHDQHDASVQTNLSLLGTYAARAHPTEPAQWGTAV